MKLSRNQFDLLRSNVLAQFIVSPVKLSYRRKSLSVIGVLDTSANMTFVSSKTAKLLCLEKSQNMVVAGHGNSANMVTKNWMAKPINLQVGHVTGGKSDTLFTTSSIVACSPTFKLKVGVLESGSLFGDLADVIVGMDVLKAGRCLIDLGAPTVMVFWGFDSSKRVKVPVFGVKVVWGEKGGRDRTEC